MQKVYSYRYMWMIEGSDKINFKIVTDTVKGLEDFENSLKSLKGLTKAGKEYLHEYDINFIGKFIDLLYKEESNNETQKN